VPSEKASSSHVLTVDEGGGSKPQASPSLWVKGILIFFGQ
jgi:hypothetical protein